MRKEESDENWLETRFVQPNGAARVAQDASNRRLLPFQNDEASSRGWSSQVSQQLGAKRRAKRLGFASSRQ